MFKVVSVNIPTEDGTVHGFSSAGINFYSDKKSHREIMKWYHNSTSRLPWFETEYIKLLEELAVLKESIRKLGA